LLQGDRTIPIEGVVRRNLIQTDAQINKGNSGGPLLSIERGDVVGLVDIVSEAHGISFAVAGRVAQPLLQAWQVAPQPLTAATCATAPSTPPVAAAPVPQQPAPAPPPAPAPTNAAEATIVAHWQLINDQDYDHAYDLFSPHFQAQVSREGWVADKLRDLPHSSAIKFPAGSVINSIDGDVNVSFRSIGSETSGTNTGCNDWTGSYHMVKTGAGWRIDSSHLSRSPC
jgi:hypothetical protein